MDKIKNILSDINAGIVLDVATGRGQFVNILKNNLKNYEKIIGIDIHKKSLETARKNFKEERDISFKNTDIFNLNKCEEYDMITISNSLHHFDNPEKCLEKCYKLLKKKGYIVISEMHKDGNQTKSQKTHIMLHHWGAMIDRILGQHHNETFNHDKLVRLSEIVTLKDKKIVKFSYPQDNKNQREIKKHIKNMLDEKIKKVDKKNVKYNEIKEKKESIIENLEKYGFAGSEMTFIIG